MGKNLTNSKPAYVSTHSVNMIHGPAGTMKIDRKAKAAARKHRKAVKRQKRGSK